MTEVNWVHDWVERPVTTWAGTTWEIRRRTIAMRMEDDGTIRVAQAICAPSDNFSKHQGRVKACGYLNSKRLSKTYETIDQLITDVGNSMVPIDGMGRMNCSNPTDCSFYPADDVTPLEGCWQRTINVTVEN